MDVKEIAREIADRVGNEVVEDGLPLQVIGLVADYLQGDYEQITQAIADISKEQKAIKEGRTSGERQQDGKAHYDFP
jgi:hypothetical protein